MDARVTRFGPWTVNCSAERVLISKTSVRLMEDALAAWLPTAMTRYREDYTTPTLAMREWGVPSFLVRFDMPPILDGTFPGFYEVEANPAGWGILGELGVDVFPKMASALRTLGIGTITCGAARNRREQLADHEAGMAKLAAEGIGIRWLNGEGLASHAGGPLWLRAGQEDMPEIKQHLPDCILLHQHGGGHKRYLLDTQDAVLLTDCETPFTRFPAGFALKPWGGWGSRNVELWAAQQPWKKRGCSFSKMAESVENKCDRGEGREWIVQRFLPPEPVQGGFRIWRACAVWNGSRYEVIGGFWNWRKDIKLHGASDTVWGALDVEC